MGRNNTFSAKSINTNFTTILVVVVTLFALIYTAFLNYGTITLDTDGIIGQLWQNPSDTLIITLFYVNLLLVGITCILLLQLNNNFAIIRYKTVLPCLFYTLFLVTDTDIFFSFTGNVITLVILLCFFQLFKFYQNSKTKEEAFNIGFLLAIGSLFSPRILLILLVIWIGFIFFKAESGKIFLASIVGLLTPYWFIFFWYAYKNMLPDLIVPFQNLFGYNPETVFHFEISGWIRMIFTAFITILAIINFQIHNFRDKIRTRVIFYFLFTAIIVVGILLILGIIPLSEFAGIYFLIAALFASHYFSTENNYISTIFFYLALITYIGLIFFD